MEDTGERLMTESFSDCTIEHLHRYAFALEYIKDKVVVDIASGEGYGSHLLASKALTVVGIDINREAVNHASNKYNKSNLQYLFGSTDNIPIETEFADVIVSFETIEHHDKHELMLKEFKRILKPNGIVIISSPDKFHYSDIPNYNNKYHIKELYSEEFKTLLKSFFKTNIFLNQKMNYCSLMISEEKTNFSEFKGNFERIEKHSTIGQPMYNIAISSDNDKIEVFSSSFNATELLKRNYFEYEKTLKIKSDLVEEIINSKTYRLGFFLTFPIRFFRNVIK